ncbi:hypothetical protein UPYG_G00338140 [Umbra pygmaea]|uniref:CREB regulated transcription coactivator 2 n=1 Tax=Umbra pygmaea TaxID=75934 RepID=A0ABD0WEZ2_UMBPY
MSATHNIGSGVGLGPGSSPCNPRKFSEKIARLTKRQAEDTAAFQEVIISTRIQVQRARQLRSHGPDYGGSLPNVNQIGKSSSDLQGQLSCSPDSGYTTRLQSTPERGQEGRLSLPVRTNRRRADNSLYRSVHLSPTAEQSWRRNWSSSSPVDKGHLMPPSITHLNRTNSDSALHTSVRNTQSGNQFCPHPHDLTSRNRFNFFPYPVPPIDENVIEEAKPLKNTKECLSVSNGTKSHEIPDTNILSSSHQIFGTLLNVPSILNTSGSLPDLSSLRLPSQQQAGVEPNKHSGALITACSTGHLPGPLLGASEDEFSLPGLSVSLQGSFSNPLLQSSHSNPNIQSSLCSHSLSSSLSSTFNLSLSNSSLQSSPSNQSLQSFLSNSSLSGQSLQSATSHCSYSSGIAGSGSCSSLSCSPHPPSQAQMPPSRKRTLLSPLVLPAGGETHRLQSKQISTFGSPPLSSIAQGFLQAPMESRPPAYHQRLPQPQCPPAVKPDVHAGPSQQLYCLTEGLQQPPSPERRPTTTPQGAHQQKQGFFGQQSVPQTHSLQPLQNQQPHQQSNLLYQCQFQLDGQKLDTLQQYRSLSQQQHPIQQQQKRMSRNLQEKQRQQYQLDLHQVYTHPQQSQQQMYTRQAEQQPYRQQQRQALQREMLQQQHQPEPQIYQQQPQQCEESGWYRQGANLPDQSLDLNRQNMSIPQNVPRQLACEHQSHAQGRSWQHLKLQGQKDQIQSTGNSAQMSFFTDNNTALYNHESYMGLHLTPSQTQALAEQLRQLSKDPLCGDSGPQCLVGKGGGVNCGTQHPKTSLYSQKQSSNDCHSHPVTDQSPSEDLSSILPLLEFDPVNFFLDSPLQIDPLDLVELNKQADGELINDTVEGHYSSLLR